MEVGSWAEANVPLKDGELAYSCDKQVFRCLSPFPEPAGPLLKRRSNSFGQGTLAVPGPQIINGVAQSQSALKV